jgi:hypothetical protein
MKCVRHQSGMSPSLAAVMLLTSLAIASVGTLQAQSPVPDLPAGSGAAKLISFSGQISVLHDSTPWALNLGDIVQPQQVIVTGPDGYGLFQVADGSKFEVFPKSHVVFRQNRGDWKDLLEVWLGKVRVQIEHPGGLPNNNRVRTPSAVISVRGTVFDVEVDDSDETTLVLDEEGQVEVRHTLQAGNSRILNPGEYVRVYKNQPLAKQMLDKAGLLQRAVRAASDAFYQAALNTRGAGSIPRTTTSTPGLPADTGGKKEPPPAPPSAPSSPSSPSTPPPPPPPPPGI